jgi:hypothetical protein
MKILNPRGDTADGAARILPSVRTLSGLRIAVLTNHWTSMDRMGERFRACAAERYGANVKLFDIPINGAMAASVEERVLRECDAAIIGLAN